MSKAKTVVLKLLAAWQWTRRFRQPACRFYPSCSEYTRQAVEKHGIAAGMRLGAVRICKCHPFHDGGVDEVPDTLTPLFAGFSVGAMPCIARATNGVAPTEHLQSELQPFPGVHSFRPRAADTPIAPICRGGIHAARSRQDAGDPRVSKSL